MVWRAVTVHINGRDEHHLVKIPDERASSWVDVASVADLTDCRNIASALNKVENPIEYPHDVEGARG